MPRTLTPRQIAVINALMTGATNEEAARLAGVSLATVERYKASPDFRENMAVVASESLKLVSEKMVATSIVAMDKLAEMISAEDTRESNRLKAIEILFKNLESFRDVVQQYRFIDEQDLEELKLQKRIEERRKLQMNGNDS